MDTVNFTDVLLEGLDVDMEDTGRRATGSAGVGAGFFVESFRTIAVSILSLE